MGDFFTFVVAGITVGSIIALVGVGLVLTYRTSGVLNFAHGAIAVVAVDLYIWVVSHLGAPWWLGAVLAVVGVGVAGALLLEPLARLLGRVPAAQQVVATIGLLIAIESASILVGPHLVGRRGGRLAPPLPSATITVAHVNIGEDQLIIMLVSLLAACCLWVFLARSRSGTATRAVVANSELLALSGTNPVRVQRLAWTIGSMFAGLSGILLSLSPTYGLAPGTINLILLPAFGAAALAGFASLPLTYVGGLLVGITGALLTRYVTTGWLLGISSTSPYIILFLALIVLSWRRPHRITKVLDLPAIRLPHAPRWVSVVAAGTLMALILTIPAWAGFGLASYTTTLVYAVLFLSLGLLLKTGGMASLCQLGFAAVGATTFGRLAAADHVPWFAALAIALLAAALCGAVVCLAAIRLAGAYLALATVAFAYILEYLVYPTSIMFGHNGESLHAPRPAIAHTDMAYYFLVVGFVVLTAGTVWAIGRSRLGRLVRGLADSPVALQAQGSSTNVTRMLIFVVSAALAGLAGVLLAALDNFVTQTYFTPDASLELVAVLFVVRLADPWYAFVAASVFYLLPAKWTWHLAGTWVSFAFGALAVYAVAAGARDRSIVKLVAAARRGRRAGITGSGEVESPERTARSVAPVLPVVPVGRSRVISTDGSTSRRRGLEIRDLTVSYGGLTAVERFDLCVGPGQIVGLIGPNGAGKTTILNACSGFVRPAGGQIMLDSEDLHTMTAAARARRGIGRTFQHVELFESLPTRDAIALSREAAIAGANPYRHVFGRRAGASTGSAAVTEAIELCGITPFSDQMVGDLSTGQRRLVELARCLVWPFTVLLLDEPTAGLDRWESAEFGRIVERVVAARGVAVLLVEHDVNLVMSVCDRVAVLDFGRMLFEGRPDEAMASEVVRSAYLGDSVGPRA